MLRLDCNSLTVTNLFTFNANNGYPLVNGTALTDSGYVFVVDSAGLKRACIADEASTTVSWIPVAKDTFGYEMTPVKIMGNHSFLYFIYNSNFTQSDNLLQYNFQQYNFIGTPFIRSDYKDPILSNNGITFYNNPNIILKYWDRLTGISTFFATSPVYKQWIRIDAAVQLSPNKMLLYGETTLSPGKSLYVSDGTRQGTTLLANPNEGKIYSNSISGMMTYGGKAYFNAYTPQHGFEPWVSDGTPTGTYMLQDLIPGDGNQFGPRQITATANGLIWSSGIECWLYQPQTGVFTDLALPGRFTISTFGNETYFVVRETTLLPGWVYTDTLKFFKLDPSLTIPVQTGKYFYDTKDQLFFFNQFAIHGNTIIDLRTGLSHLHPVALKSIPYLDYITTSTNSFFSNNRQLVRISVYNKLDTLHKTKYSYPSRFNKVIDSLIYIDLGMNDSLLICNLDGSNLQVRKYKYDTRLSNKYITKSDLFSIEDTILIVRAGGPSGAYEYLRLKGDSICYTNRLSHFDAGYAAYFSPVVKMDSGTYMGFSGGGGQVVRKLLPQGGLEFPFGFREDSTYIGDIQIVRGKDNDSIFYIIHTNLLYKAGIDPISTTLVDSISGTIARSNYIDPDIEMIDKKVIYSSYIFDSVVTVWSAGPASASTQQLWSYTSRQTFRRNSGLLPYHDKVYWIYWDVDSQRIQLMATDGTPAGTSVVKTLAESIDTLMAPFLIRNKPEIINDTLYIQVKENAWGTKLWRSDGTPSGTTLMAHIMPADSGSGTIESLTPLQGKWYALYDHDLWKENLFGFNPLYRPRLIRIDPVTGTADSLLSLPDSSAGAGMFILRDSLFILTTLRPVYKDNSLLTLWKYGGGTQVDSVVTLVNYVNWSSLNLRTNGANAIINIIDSIAYFALSSANSFFRSNGKKSGTWDVDNSKGFIRAAREPDDYSRIGDDLVESTYARWYLFFYSPTGCYLRKIGNNDSTLTSLPYTTTTSTSTMIHKSKPIRNKIYDYGWTDAGTVGASAYYIPVWETLPGTNTYAVPAVKGDLWHYSYKNVQTILGINTNGLDLGTVTVEMDDRLQPEVIDSVAFVPRHFTIHCEGGPDCPTDGVLPHPIRVQLYFADAELDSLNSVTGLPNPIEALDVVHYNGLVNDCDLSNNPLPGFTTRIPSTQVKARDWMYGFSLEFSTTELGEFAVTNDLVFNAVAPARTPKDALQLWPNPGRDAVMVKTPCAHMHHLRVLDVTGKVLLQFTMDEATEYLLPISAIPAGTYIVQAETDCGQQSTLLVKAQ